MSISYKNKTILITGGTGSFGKAFVKKVLKIEPLKKKLTSFNCNVSEINGHNINQIVKSLNSKNNSKPNIIIANTIKGKGVKFMENTILWHYKSPNKEQFSDAMKELK